MTIYCTPCIQCPRTRPRRLGCMSPALSCSSSTAPSSPPPFFSLLPPRVTTFFLWPTCSLPCACPPAASPSVISFPCALASSICVFLLRPRSSFNFEFFSLRRVRRNLDFVPPPPALLVFHCESLGRGFESARIIGRERFRSLTKKGVCVKKKGWRGMRDSKNSKQPKCEG